MSGKRETVPVKDLTDCARCGGNHAAASAEKLDRPIVTDGRIWTHWIACPTNGQPIMVEIKRG